MVVRQSRRAETALYARTIERDERLRVYTYVDRTAEPTVAEEAKTADMTNRSFKAGSPLAKKCD